jgi:acylphosphatase
MPMNVTVVVVVRGRVQGVGFRAWTEVTALELGLGGWVRNRRDGSVEALLIGPDEVVSTMIERCRGGPPGARVDTVDQREAGSADLALRRPGDLFSMLPSF